MYYMYYSIICIRIYFYSDEIVKYYGSSTLQIDGKKKVKRLFILLYKDIRTEISID